MADSIADKITKRLADLKTERQKHETVWKDCFEYSFPVRGTGFNEQVTDAKQIRSKKSRLFDATLTDAAKTQASAIISGLTPANSRWFSLEVNEASDNEKRWLDKAADTIWQNIHSSNFDSAAYEGNLDLMAAGWFALYVDTDRDKGGFTFQLWPIASVFCDSTRADGKIDVVYRYFQLTAEQIVSEYGDALSEQFKSNAIKEPSKKFKVIHAIYPRKDGNRVKPLRSFL